jgi:hypothetical protein
MNLAFVSLFGLTELYQAIGKGLTAEGHCIFWITTNQHWTYRLVNEGATRERILELVYTPSDFLDDDTKGRIKQELGRCEAGCDLTVNQCLLMDRFLTERPVPRINEYVYLYYRDLKRFFSKNKIDYVFAEPTNLNDMLAYMICRELGIKYRSPRDMRFPSGRTVFFKGYRQEEIVPRRYPDTTINGRDLIDEYADRQSAPSYFDRFKNEPVVQPGRIMRAVKRRLGMVKTLKQPSLTHYGIWGRIKLVASRSARAFYMRRLCKYDRLESIEGKIAYYGLHVQPENAVDVLGSYFSDQLKLIKDLRRALPSDTCLVVKEHPTFLGQRSVRFFREVKRLPNVRLVDHRESSFDIYRRADLVLTISGTIAYEAGLLGVPAVTFSRMYFDSLSSVHYCSDITRLKALVEQIRTSEGRDLDADYKVVTELVGNSYPAWWSDPFFGRSSLSDENITNLTRAFLGLLNHDPD